MLSGAISKELCPVKSSVSPSEYTHPFYGRTFGFPAPITSRVGAEIAPSHGSAVDILLTEPGRQSTLLVNPVLGDYESVRTWVTLNEPLRGCAMYVPQLENTDERTRKYYREGVRNLHTLHGEGYEFVVGQNQEGVILDAWRFEPQILAWRVAIPYDGRHPVLVNSRLLVCAQQ